MPSDLILSVRKAVSDFSFSSALVCWYRLVLLAEPPPLAAAVVVGSGEQGL